MIAFLLSAQIQARAATNATSSAAQERSKDTLEYYGLEEKLREKEEVLPEEKAVIEETGRPEAPTPLPEEAVIQIKKIKTNPSAILSDEEIRRIAGEYEGKSAGIKDLLELVERINGLYREKHYPTARATLPPQKIENGVVEIRLIEVRVGNIVLENNRSTRDSFILGRIPARPGNLVNLDQLEKELFFFNSVNDVKIRAVLKPGEAFGTTDYTFRVEEPRKYEGMIFLDNAGQKDIGLTRLNFSAWDSSLLGYRDRFTVGGTLADGTTEAYLAYNVPVSTRGSRLGLSYDYSETSIKSGPLKELNIGGNSYSFGAYFSHPLIAERTVSVNGFAGYNAKKSVTEFEDLTLFDTRVKSVSGGIDYLSSGGYGSWYTRHYLTQGFDRFGADKKFLKYNGECSLMKPLPREVFAFLRVKSQVSGTELLPASEQFQLGGISTVRGYSEGALLGDSGWFLSAELNAPVRPRREDGREFATEKNTRFFVFADAGGTFRMRGGSRPPGGNDLLVSTGAGLSVNLKNDFPGRFTFGIPLRNLKDEDSGGPRLNFYIPYRF